MINIEALFKISYGLYIVCSGDKQSGNGFISNSVFQVTSEPAKFAFCCNKNNYTIEFIKKYNAFSVSILDENVTPAVFGKFGYRSGRDIDKLAGMNIKYGDTGVPIIINDCLAYLECKVNQIVDAGTHLMFIGELISSDIIDDTKTPLTYLYYRQVKKGITPKNAPTYIDKSKPGYMGKDISFKKYKCAACGYIYDEANEKIRFKDLSKEWICPVCGSDKSDFIEI